MYKRQHKVIEWYDIASKIVNTPKIHKLIGNTITMEYIEPIGDVDVEKLCNTLENFKTIPSHKVTFDSYIDRVKTHWYNNWPDQEEDWNWLEDLTEYLDENHSFCHGDASIDNFISSWNQDIVMIDPIYEKELWSSWLLDVSKLQMSLRRFEGVTDRYDSVSYTHLTLPTKRIV